MQSKSALSDGAERCMFGKEELLSDVWPTLKLIVPLPHLAAGFESTWQNFMI